MASAEHEVHEAPEGNIAEKACGLGEEVETIRDQLRAIRDLASVQEARLDTLRAQALHIEDQTGQENTISSAATLQQQLNATLSQLRIATSDGNTNLERINILDERLNELDDALAMRLLNENQSLREQNLALLQRISKNDQVSVQSTSSGSTSATQSNAENENDTLKIFVSQLRNAWLGGRRERRNLRGRLRQLEAQLRILQGHGIDVGEPPGVQSAEDPVSAEEWTFEMEMYRRRHVIDHFFRHGFIAQDEDGDIQLEIKMEDHRIEIYRGLDEINSFFRQLAMSTDMLALSVDTERRRLGDDSNPSRRPHTHIYQTGSSIFVLRQELESQSLPPEYDKKLNKGDSEQELHRIQLERDEAIQARHESLHERDMAIMGRDQARAERERTPSPPDRQESPMDNASTRSENGSLSTHTIARDRSRSPGLLERRLTQTQRERDRAIQERDEARQLLDSLRDDHCPTRLAEARANLESVVNQLNEIIPERDQVLKDLATINAETNGLRQSLQLRENELMVAREQLRKVAEASEDPQVTILQEELIRSQQRFDTSLADAQRILQAAVAERDHYAEQMEAGNEALSLAERSIETLETTLRDAPKAGEGSRVAELQQELESLEQSLKDRLAEGIADAQRSLQEAVSERDHYAEQMEAGNEALLQAEKRLRLSEGNVERLENELRKEIEAGFGQRAKEADDAFRPTEEHPNISRAEAQNTTEDIQANLQLLRAAVQDARGEGDANEREVGRLTRSLQEAREETNTTGDQVQHLERAWRDAQVETDTAMEQVHRIKAALQSAKISVAMEEVHLLEGTLRAIRTDSDAYCTGNSEAQAATRDLQRNVERLEASLQVAQDERDAAREESRRLTNLPAGEVVDLLRRRLFLAEETLARQATDLQEMLRALETARNERDVLIQDVEVAPGSLRAVTEQFESTARERDLLLLDVGVVRANLRTVTEQFESTARERDLLVFDHGVVRGNLQTVTERLDNISRHRDLLVSDVERLTTELRNIKTQKDLVQEQLEDCKEAVALVAVSGKDPETASSALDRVTAQRDAALQRIGVLERQLRAAEDGSVVSRNNIDSLANQVAILRQAGENLRNEVLRLGGRAIIDGTRIRDAGDDAASEQIEMQSSSKSGNSSSEAKLTNVTAGNSSSKNSQDDSFAEPRCTPRQAPMASTAPDSTVLSTDTTPLTTLMHRETGLRSGSRMTRNTRPNYGASPAQKRKETDVTMSTTSKKRRL